MKNKELFERTVSVLVKAYQNDTLVHGDCKACAVGNLVAHGCGIKNINDEMEWFRKALSTPTTTFGWGSVFITRYDPISGIRKQSIQPFKGRIAEFQINSTGYDYRDLAKIEYAFEAADQGENDDDYMLNGLLSVYDVLCDIHEVDNDEVKKGELVFVK